MGTYQGTFRIATEAELGIKLTGNKYGEEVIISGSKVPLKVNASGKKSNGLFLFVDLEIPTNFALDGFNSNSWHPIKDRSNIYCFSTETSCVALGSANGTSSIVLSGIIISTDAEGGSGYSVTITGFAIQAANIAPKHSNPIAISNMIEGKTNANP